MSRNVAPFSHRLRARLREALSGPHLLAFIPAITLGAFWIGGEGALTIVALLTPILFALVGGIEGGAKRPVHLVDLSLAVPREELEYLVENNMQAAAQKACRSVCYLAEIDDARALSARHGQSAADQILRRCGERLQSTLRDADIIRRAGEHRFLIQLDPVRHLTLDTAIKLASRFQAALEEPLSIDGTKVYCSSTIGFCISTRSPDDTARGLISAADIALAEAQRSGAGSVRSYSSEMKEEMSVRQVFAEEVTRAVDEGEFEPWFQPQVSTDTGRITGFEALARWIHPQKGLIPPVEFLPTVEHLGKIERLGELMLSKALAALRKWDEAGFDIPAVAVNFSDAELRNPRLVDRIKWELDRFELAPERLTVEVLESVVASSPDDITARNINALAELGCGIDLDDFGTGQASISAVRRFSVGRLKIDRSFVMKADRDPDQQRLIGAILSMAEQLGLATVAEGVETRGEHALLAQLGCDHVQGFGIARPMSASDTIDWIADYNRRLTAAPTIGRAAG